MNNRGRRIGFVGPALIAVLCGTSWFSARPAVAVPDSGCTMAEVAAFLEPGDAAIEGTLSHGASGEKLKLGDGRPIELLPRVPCVEQWMATPAAGSFDSSGRRVNYPQDPIFQRALRHTTTDAKGRFAIFGLPAGRYWLRTSWVAQKPTAYSVTTTGQYIDVEFELAPGQTKTFRLTPQAPTAKPRP